MPTGRTRAAGAAPALSLLAALLLWEAAVRALGVRPVILPAPSAVARVLFASRDLILHHAWATGAEVLLGFSVGAAVGLCLAFAFHWSRLLRAALEPHLLASQLVPKAALAPLLVIWLGYGLKAKVAVVATVCFFPAFINAFQGLTAHDPDLDLLMRCLGANRITELLRVGLPFAVPSILAGLRTSAVLAVTGCVIAEFVGADRGLGFLLLSSEGQLDTPMVFAALAALSVIGALVYAIPVVLERTVLRRYMPAERPGLELAAGERA